MQKGPPNAGQETAESMYQEPASKTAETKPWKLSLHQGVALIQFVSGTLVTPQMLKDVYHGLNDQPDKYRTTNMVWDLRNIVFAPSIGFEEVMRIVHHIQSTWEQQSGFRSGSHLCHPGGKQPELQGGAF